MIYLCIIDYTRIYVLKILEKICDSADSHRRAGRIECIINGEASLIGKIEREERM